MNQWSNSNDLLVPHRSPIVIIRVLRTISRLMMKGNTEIIVWPGHAWATRKGFLHLGLWARTACEVGVAANRCKGRGTRGEIVIRKRGEGRSAMTIVGMAVAKVRRSSVPSNTAPMPGTRVERRCV